MPVVIVPMCCRYCTISGPRWSLHVTLKGRHTQ